MDVCTNCIGVETIQDLGMVHLKWPHGEPPQLPSSFKAWESVSDHSQIYSIQYDSIEQLLDLLHSLEAFTLDASDEAIQLNISGAVQTNRAAKEIIFQSLPLYLTRVHHNDLISIIKESQFTSYMQPVLSARNESLFGYELLLRPLAGSKSFSPYDLFELAQETGLHSFLDRQARISAIHTSSDHIKLGLKRFINFLPSSIYNPNFCLSHTFKAIEQTKQDPNDFVFEVVETEEISDFGHLQNIFKVYQDYGMKVALDDVGMGFSSVETIRLLKPDIVKIDRDLISFCDEDELKMNKIKEIIEVSQNYGALVLAEGIERKEEWEACKSWSIDLGQGYLFGRPLPIPL